MRYLLWSTIPNTQKENLIGCKYTPSPKCYMVRKKNFTLTSSNIYVAFRSSFRITIAVGIEPFQASVFRLIRHLNRLTSDSSSTLRFLPAEFYFLREIGPIIFKRKGKNKDGAWNRILNDSGTLQAVSKE